MAAGSTPNDLISSQSLSDGAPQESQLPDKSELDSNFEIYMHLYAKTKNLPMEIICIALRIFSMAVVLV